MKTKIKITVIALLGVSFAANAQVNDTGNKVGIGTKDPKHKLDVNTITGNFKTYNYGAESTLNVIGGWARAFRLRNERDNKTVAFGGNSGNAYISTNFDIVGDPTGYKNQKLTVARDGKVGIGIANPRCKLDIRGKNAKYSDFAQYSGISEGSFLPNGKKPTLLISESVSGTYKRGKGGQRTYKGGLSFGHGGSGIYSVNPNPAGSFYYGDIRFHTTSWNGKTKSYYNADRMVIKVDGKVGIGIANPRCKLDIRGKNAKYSDFAQYSGISEGSFLPNGKKPTLLISESVSGTYTAGKGGQRTYKGGLSFGHGGSGIYSVNPNPAGSFYYGDIRFHTTSWNGKTKSHYNADRMVIKVDGKVGIGTTKPTAKLSVNGKIHTKEVKINLKLSDWADFVFKKDYSLPTLKEVENHIKEKGHLKDIPSAKEVAKNGILLGEMNSKLLQKIEELTLYTIQQGKEIKELKEQNSKIEKLEKQNKILKLLLDRVSRLEEVIN